MQRVAVPLALTPEAARPREGRAVSLEGPTMGVSWRLRAHAPFALSVASLTHVIQTACDQVVAEMSNWEPHSALSVFNRAPAQTWRHAPTHLFTVASAAIEIAQLTGGAFDPTLGAVVDLWGFGPPGPMPAAPSPERLAAVRAGWRGLALDRHERRLFQPGRLDLDLSGIAKGYGVDLAAEALRAFGLRDFLLEIGGELRGEGVKGDGEPWWVEIERPPGADLDEPPVLVALHGLSIATSGDWRRRTGGHSHTIDPRNRRPVDGRLAAATVLHAECMRADALCTALMVLGPEAEAFACAHDIAALLVVHENNTYREVLTPAFEALLA